MKKLALILLLILSVALQSCEEDELPDRVEQTVFMYLPWSTNLKSYFETNISDFESVVKQGILKNEKIVVFLSTSPTQAELFELKYDKGECQRKKLKNYTYPAFTTADGICAILNDVKTFAPAGRYAMTIGCHGMGWLPVAASATTATKMHSLGQKKHWEYEGVPMTRYFGGLSSEYQTNTTTLAEGIARAGMKMEYILFDDCYMSSIEVAYDLKDVTDHLIACPTEIMAYGMPYAEIGPHLLGKVDYEAICDAFYDFYSSYTIPCGTIGVTVTAELDKLTAVMKEINGKHTFPTSSLYSVQTMDGYNPTLFFDCGDYVAKLCKEDDELLARFETQLERTVPYKRHTSYYYSASNGFNKINAYSGVTVSDPSIDSEASAKYETAWYQATH